jgi:hypothetical protein
MRKYICDSCKMEIKHGAGGYGSYPYSLYEFPSKDKNNSEYLLSTCFIRVSDNDRAELCIDCARYLCGRV